MRRGIGGLPQVMMLWKADGARQAAQAGAGTTHTAGAAGSRQAGTRYGDTWQGSRHGDAMEGFTENLVRSIHCSE